MSALSVTMPILPSWPTQCFGALPLQCVAVEGVVIANVRVSPSTSRALTAALQALELFADNPFKVALISNKVPEGALTTAYRCGPLIDLCMGPHIPGQTLPAVAAVYHDHHSVP